MALVSLFSATLVAVAEEPSRATIYGTDSQHLWNRLHAVLFVRRGSDGNTYGNDRLEPLLWPASKHLIEERSRDRAVAVLDKFLDERGERLVDDPVKQAMLQRDLWLVFNWLHGDHSTALMSEPKPSPDDIKTSQDQLLHRLAAVIGRLALSPEDIQKLPDNYAAAVDSGKFAKQFDPDEPDEPFLPPDLLDKDGPWVCLGRADGPVAPEHLYEGGGNAFTNSAFLVFLRLPEGRTATLQLLKRLNAFDQPLMVRADEFEDRHGFSYLPNPKLPPMPVGTQVALVRQALLIDASNRVAASNLTESVQLRVYREVPAMSPETVAAAVVSGTQANRRARSWQSFFEFRLSRRELFAGRTGGLVPLGIDERDFKTGFGAHPFDEFERHLAKDGSFAEISQQPILKESCFACHRLPGTYSLNSYVNFRSSNLVRRRERDDTKRRPPTLVELSIGNAQSRAVEWKEARTSWTALRKCLVRK